MILYFSGTGNSRYAAKLIGLVTGDGAVSMNEPMRRGERGGFSSETPFVFVTPTHGWRIPEIAEDFIRGAGFYGSTKAYFVMACGDSAGNAGRYNRRLCAEKGFEYMGTAAVVMPENYIAMFDVPDAAEAADIVRRAEPGIVALAGLIRDGRPFPAEKATAAGRFQSAVANPVFRALFIRARAFRAADACIGCGKCAERCPANNIRLSGGRPLWGTNCTHCMACICGCPAEAIEYGGRSKGKPRYFNADEPTL